MNSKHEQNEARVLRFSRELLHSGVHMARVALRRGENSLLHKHTRTRDTFFVMEGYLTVEVHVASEEAVSSYRGLFRADPEIRRKHDCSAIHRVRLSTGEILIVEPGVVHCAMNLDDHPTHFLCLEGIGEYDFIEM